MGSVTSETCLDCGETFSIRSGGGFVFDRLHCEQCGADKSVGHQELGDTHLRFIKGLKVPYAVARAEMDRRIQDEYPGKPLSRKQYHAAVEGDLAPCACGGRFRYDAPPRCPKCRSTPDRWDPSKRQIVMHFD